MKTFQLSLLLFLVGLLSACTALKPYERIYVSDPEMETSQDSGGDFVNYVHSIREGATAPTGTKGNGGCGCN